MKGNDAGKRGKQVPMHFDLPPGRARVAAILVALGTYGLVFFPTYSLMGRAATALAVLPVMTIGWLLGMQGGLLAALFCLLSNIILLNLVGQPGLEVLTRPGGGALGSMLLVLIGGMVGRMSDLGRQATWELAARQEAEEKLRQSETRYRALIENSADAIVLLDADGAILYRTPSANLILGYSLDENIGRNVFELMHPEDIPQVRQVFTRLLQQPRAEGHIQFRCRHKDGTWRRIEASGSNLLGEPSVRALVVNYRDITERQQAEEEREAIRDFLQTTIDGLSEPMMVIGTDYLVKLMNRAMQVRYPAGKRTGPLYCYQVSHDRDTPCSGAAHPCPLEQVRESLRPVTMVHEHIRQDGEKRFVELIASPLLGKDGTLTGIVESARDITARRRAEAELVKLQQAVETSGEVIFLTDREGILTYVNPEFTRLYGHAAEEVVGKVTPRILKSGRMKPEDYAWFWQTILNKQVVKGELVNKTKDGRFITIEGSASPILDEGGSIIGFLAIQRDITERKQTEEALYEERQLFIGGTNVVFKWSPEEGWPVEYVSPNVRNQFGYAPEELVCDEFRYATIVHPDDLARVAEEVNAYTQAGVPCFEQEYRIARADGEYRWIYDFTVPVRDEQGKIARYHGYVQDITERKQAEQERARLLQETHRRAEELEALAEVASALRTAHTVEEMLPLLVRKAAEAVGGAAGSIFLIEPETGDLVSRGWLAASDGWRFTSDASLTLRHRPGEGVTGHVAATGEIYITRDLPHDPLAVFLAGEVERLRSIHSGISLPLRTQERIVGVLHIWRHEDRSFAGAEVRLLTSITEMAGNALHRAALHEQTERDAVELTLAYDTTLEGWARALELRDRETEGHTRRVTEMTLRLTRAMGIGEDELVHVRRGALLHDIGKIGVPDSILHKPDKLSDEEWIVMRKHPRYAYDILSSIAYLRPALDIPYSHHEKWDGTGYPRGLKGEQIPLAARIFAVVDVWDALTSDRPYRKAWSQKKTLKYIQEQSGTHFDPAVVAAFLAGDSLG